MEEGVKNRGTLLPWFTVVGSEQVWKTWRGAARMSNVYSIEGFDRRWRRVGRDPSLKAPPNAFKSVIITLSQRLSYLIRTNFFLRFFHSSSFESNLSSFVARMILDTSCAIHVIETINDEFKTQRNTKNREELWSLEYPPRMDGVEFDRFVWREREKKGKEKHFHQIG